MGPKEEGLMNGESEQSEARLVVHKSIVVNAPQALAFKFFVEAHGEWWPLERYHIGRAPADTAIIEPRVGGRWYERAGDGTECDWGRVLAWDPPNRIVLSWDISAEWQFERQLGTEVDVRFVAIDSQTTRLELEHRLLERYGDRASMMHSIFDADGGWGTILEHYATRVS